MNNKFISIFLYSCSQVMILNFNYFKVNWNLACVTVTVDLNTRIAMTFFFLSSPEGTKYKQNNSRYHLLDF